jgi:hypothetical protein
MGGPESKGNTYYNMMKHNTDTVVDALKGEKFAETKFKSETKGTNPMVYVAFGVSLLLLLIPIILKLNK